AVVQKSDSRSLIATLVIQLNSGSRDTTFNSLAHHLWVRHWANHNSVDAFLVHDDQLMNSKYILLCIRFLSRSGPPRTRGQRSEEHTSELQSPCNLVCRLLLEKKKKKINNIIYQDRY